MNEFGESSYRRFLRGDENALVDLIRTYSDALVRFAYSYVKDSAAAEDVAGECFALLMVKKKHFSSEEAMRSYLYKTARSRCVDYLRRHKNEVPLEDVENVLSFGSTEESYLRQYRDEKLYLCMQALPVQYREVLQLIHLSGFSMEETCKIMGKNRKQVYNLHNRAKIALKNLLEQEGITHEDI